MSFKGNLLLATLCVALSACNIPDTTMANGAVTLKDNVVTLHPDGAPDAMINSSGALQIGDKTVTTTPAQQGLLVLYYQSIVDVHDTGVQMGLVGKDMGMAAIKDKLGGQSKDQANQDVTDGGNKLKTLGHKICQDQQNMYSVQTQLAAQIPDFKPYATIFKQDDSKCDDDDKN